MPAPAFDYAVVRVVPRVERHEFINVGVIVYCPSQAFLDCRVALDTARLRALWPAVRVDPIECHLLAFAAVCRGEPSAGPIALLPAADRFHWLVHPRSAVIQVSSVHSGMAVDLGAALDRLFAGYVG